ncbi:ATP-binding protein [Mycetocola zhadangensis]|uniref:ATP-binding protein n=1 Tax=Mycetocola zhadangensis TaxID=1164595 RepID=A0A3L7J5U2_9MICO|nr:ATP-binding protein [Mycetocola zhadangensis]RLQ85904.1 ATP-binding protein [Mycetocola zhadangensis]
MDLAVAHILSRVDVQGADVLLIDGPSGAGKSTLADAIVENWPAAEKPTLIRMDDIYPGWGGLAAAGEHVRTRVLEPRSLNQNARWQRHDWTLDAPAEWHDVPSALPLLVEGCGVLTRASAALATVTVWLDADDAVRKERALARDDGAFDAHWDDWDQQFARFVRDEDPVSSAKLVLRAS